MRILEIAPVPPELGGRDTGGIATHLHGLATHLAARGHDVAVLADNRVYDPAAWPIREADVSVYGIADFAGAARARALASPVALRQLTAARRALPRAWSIRWTASKVAAYRAVIAAFRPDVVHVHTLESRYALADAVIGDKLPIVATVHSSHYIDFAEESLRDTNTRLIAGNLARAKHLVFVSDFLERRYGELFPGALDRLDVRVVPNPIDASIYAPISRADARTLIGCRGDELVLVFVGNLIVRKDPASLIRAVAVLAGRDVRVKAILVGVGPEEAALRALAQSEGVTDSVRFDGRKNQAELPAYYSAADVLVFPSIMESFGLVAVEAMLCGTPVVGTPEVFSEVVPECCGIVARPGDPASLADAVADALARTWDHDEIRRYALGFDWDERVAEFEAIYEGLLEAR